MSADRPSKTIPINLAEPGQVLSSDVHNEKGQKVVSGDTELTSELIKRLVGSGVNRITIYGEREQKPDVAEDTEADEQQKQSTGPKTREDNGRLVIEEDLAENYVGEGDVTLEGDIDNGAVLNARGDVQVLGEIRDGTVRAMSGEIDIDGTIHSSGDTVQLISNQPIQVSTVIDSSLSVRGHLIVEDTIKNSRVECLGNLIVHGNQTDAQISGSNLQVEGKVMADRVKAEDSDPSEFSFRDPEVVSINRKQKKTKSKLEDLKQEAEKLKNLVDTVKELGDQVKSLPDDKKEKIKKRTEKYQSVQQRIDRANNEIEEYEETLESLRDDRRYFMRVLDLLQADTSIQFEEASLNVDENERDVRLYKKGMIVIQDASDLPLELSEWLTN